MYVKILKQLFFKKKLLVSQNFKYEIAHNILTKKILCKFYYRHIYLSPLLDMIL